MSHEHLEAASEAITSASESADGETADRLADHADQLARLADGTSDPDHGRLARHEHALRSIVEDADEETTAEVNRGLAEIRSFRETLEGV